jgi:hypothetical protein
MTESITLTFNGTSKTVSNLPDGTGDMIEDAYAFVENWTTEVTDPDNPSVTIPNPESKSDLVFRIVRESISDTTRAANRAVAVVPVLAEVDAQIDAINDGAIVTETPGTTGTT